MDASKIHDMYQLITVSNIIPFSIVQLFNGVLGSGWNIDVTGVSQPEVFNGR